MTEVDLYFTQAAKQLELEVSPQYAWFTASLTGSQLQR